MWEFASWLRLDRPPTRVGVYQVDCLDGWYSFWDGARFNSLGSDPEDAYERRNELGGAIWCPSGADLPRTRRQAMSDKPTKGPWAVEADASGPKIRGADGVFVARIAWMPGQEQANARLIAESGTVHHETGLTPRELLEQIELLQQVLQIAVVQNELDMLLTGDELRTARAALQATERKTT